MARVFSDEELLDFVREAAEGSHMISRNTYVQYRERQKALGRDLPALETIIKRFGLGWYGVEAVAGLGDLHSNPLAPLYELKRFLDERPAEAELVGPTAFHALVERVATEGSDALFAAGTCGIVVGVWRDTIEPLHYRFSNAEMALTSIATCVDLKPLITDMHHVAEQLPWQGIAAVVTRDDRVVLEGRTTSEVFGGEWGDVKGEIQKRCESHSEGGSLGRYVLW